MHIFGSKPMADPLDLVFCNTCKKPIKASQYAVHAERCSSGKVNPNDSMGTGIDDDCGTKKPPKKGRKIKLTSNGSILLLDKKLVVFIYFTYCHECLHDASCILIILMWNIFLLIHCFLTGPSML
jgi:hypothetical protein